MGCSTITVKLFSVIINILLALLSIVAIVLTAISPGAVPNDWNIPTYIIFGFVILFAIIGCVAALRESICLTVTCAVFLLMLAILQAIVTINILNVRHDQGGVTVVDVAWDHDNMDYLEKKYQCCGKDSSQDYILLNRPIPSSCYQNEIDTDADKMFTEGCSAMLQRYYENQTTSIAVSSFVIMGVETLAFLLAVFLVINFRNEQRRMQF